MNQLFSLCLALAAVASPFTLQSEDSSPIAAPTQETKILWYTSLKEAQEKAKLENIPLYVCFSGTSWCFWCKRLEKEIQSSPIFIQKTLGKFIFVLLDIPKDQSAGDPELKDLMMKYEVYGVPVILILSPQMEKLGQLSYQSIAPQDFAELALTIGYPQSTPKE